MNFNVNSPILYIVVAAVIAIVLAQSAFFLIKAWKRGLALGMEKTKLRKIALTAAVFTVAPAVAIVISVIALSKDLGIPLPWLRLSVVGSLSYEAIAASNAMNAMDVSMGTSGGLNATQYVTVASVMTLSIMVGIWLVPVLCKKLRTGMISLEKRDAKWADIFSASMFIGMISAFVGFVFCDVSSVFKGDMSGLIPVLVMAVSAVVMVLSGLLVKVKKLSFISDYALPISLLAGMASAIPISSWLS
ncbi:MAG: DUF5058 family protein [Ruminococcaceae bacterium]|nr:DUF5058 family protein [Oscillospiraceae bacterium]